MRAVIALLLIGIIVVFLSLIIWACSIAQQRREQSLRGWHQAARDLGLKFTGSDSKRSIHGWLNGVPVGAHYEPRGASMGNTRPDYDRTTFYTGVGAGIPVSLALRKESSIRRLVGGRDEQLGDEKFDAVVELSRVDAFGCAALSHAAREKLRSLVEIGGEVREGRLVHETVGGEVCDRNYLVQTLQFIAHLSQLLSVNQSSLHERLVFNALRDPSPAVREKNLRFLVDPNTHTPSALLASTARALLADEHLSLRLVAAQLLGPEGSPVLCALALDPSVDTDLRIQALRALDEEGSSDLGALLATLLEPSPPELVCAALSVIAARRLGALAGGVVVGCSTSEHEAVRAAAASALAALAPDGAEAVLIRLLADPSADVQRASAEALGTLGSVAAVEPLLRSSEGLARGPLRHVVRGAIARIQSRLGHVEAGCLSLVHDHELAGALDIAEGASAQGALSLAEEAVGEPASSRDHRAARGPTAT
jgi:HEAT repeats